MTGIVLSKSAVIKRHIHPISNRIKDNANPILYIFSSQSIYDYFAGNVLVFTK